MSWWLWDFGSNAYNTVILSFVFSVYVTTAAAPDPQTGQSVYSLLQTIAGIAVAILAPMLGAWADHVQRRRRMLAGATLGVVLCIALCWFVLPFEPGRGTGYLFLGAALIALANMFQDAAEIFYNSMLLDISTPANVGRISGIGWGLGYLGGVLTLAGSLVLFVLNGGLLGVPETEAMNYRAIALFCALWLCVMSLPIMFRGPDGNPAERGTSRFNPLRAYVDIAKDLRDKFRHSRGVLHFLVASAIYRDGLAAVFAFAGVIAATSYGMEQTEVIIFGLAANFAAALGAWIFGLLDDRLGPRVVIIFSLVAMIMMGAFIIAIPATSVFWGAGLVIAALVGPVQSASRTLLARIIEPGEESEMFGLYATVGRGASWIAPAFISLFTVLLGTRMGMLGIVLTLVIGLAAFLPLRIEGVTHNRQRA